MCTAVRFQVNGELRVVAAGRGTVPVRRRAGGLALVDWGYGGDNIRKLPDGTSVTLDELRDHRWAEWVRSGLVKPVKVLISDFMINSLAGSDLDRWFALEPGQFLQGALVQRDDVLRVYFVKVPPPQSTIPSGVQSFWPRIVTPERSSLDWPDDEDEGAEHPQRQRTQPRYQGPLLNPRRGQPSPEQGALLDRLARTLAQRPWWMFVAPPSAPCRRNNGTIMRHDHTSWRSTLPPCNHCPGGCTVWALTSVEARIEATKPGRRLLQRGVQTKR